MGAAPGWREGVRPGLFYAAYFAYVGIYQPFWPVWLADRGLGAAEIGLVLSAGLWLKVVANPLIAQAADRRGERRRPVLLLCAVAFAAFAALAAVDGFLPLLLLAAIAAVCLSAALPLGDAVTMAAVLAGRLDYGRVRLWGSLAFIAASAAGGWLVAGAGVGAVLPAMLALIAVTGASALLLPEGGRPAEPPRRGAALRLLADPAFRWFLLTACLSGASHAVLYGFASLHWRAAGIGETGIGLLWAVGVVAEIVLFAVGGAAVRRLGPIGLIALGCAGGVVRWSLLATTTWLPALVAAQCLHGLTFGAAHLGAMHFVARQAPPGATATAQSLYSAVAMGIAVGAGTLAAGLLYERLVGHAFWVMSGLSAAALLALLPLARHARAGDAGDRRHAWEGS